MNEALKIQCSSAKGVSVVGRSRVAGSSVALCCAIGFLLFTGILSFVGEPVHEPGEPVPGFESAAWRLRGSVVHEYSSPTPSSAAQLPAAPKHV